ncbi:MAG TPA: chemotaxis protein CheC [Anaerolineales bacterium]|nr:chemotaxis protein CheC [Anaerolineales bacterium]HNO30507.1 chemotaxis protein CheC [Anaerolineales bacterium]
MQTTIPFDQDLLDKLSAIASEGIKNAAAGFSGMVGRKIEVDSPTLEIIPLLTIPKVVGGPEDDAVGVYLRFEGDMVGQIMMIIPYQKALELVDMLMGLDKGATQTLGTLERSALGELGNLCGSFFLNSIAKSVNADIRPSPPAVMVDMVGAILDIVVATVGGISEHVLLVHANLMDGTRFVETDFWVLPDMKALHGLINNSSI